MSVSPNQTSPRQAKPSESMLGLSQEQQEMRAAFDKTVFGFWVYLITDCILFATLFITYGVMHNNTAGGPSSAQIFELPSVLGETLLLLTSSFTCGLMILSMQKRNLAQLKLWLTVTLLLGLCFLSIELNEIHHLIADGNSWRVSGFLSSFFTLVGTHGLHITSGIIWGSVLLWQASKKGLGISLYKRITLFSLFWHLLDIVWIFIFSIVYLMGVN